MLFKTAAATSLFFALILPTFAQTHTDCNPLLAKCNPDPALASLFNWDFSSQGKSDRFKSLGYGDKVSYDDEGAHFSISESGDAPTISSEFYIMFGQVDIVAKSAPGIGIVSAAVLISDNLDEIDWEWLGKDNNQVQTNYFSKGDDSTFDRGGFSHVANAQDDYHTYGIEWTAARIVWTIDGETVRVLENPGTGYYPQTPMQVRLGSWSAGDSKNRKGTIEWAGGETDYTNGPYVFTVKSLYIQNYSTGKEYVYGDHTGSWTSIQATEGAINSDNDVAHVALHGVSDKVQGSDSNKNDQSTPSSSSTSSSSSVLSSISISTSTPAPSPTSIIVSLVTEAAPSSTATSAKYDSGMYTISGKLDDCSYNPKLYGRFKDTLFERSNSNEAASNFKAKTAKVVVIAALCALVITIAF